MGLGSHVIGASRFGTGRTGYATVVAVAGRGGQQGRRGLGMLESFFLRPDSLP